MIDDTIRRRRVFIGATALAAVVFIFDLVLPLGVAGGVPYVAVVVISLWSTKRQDVLGAAILCTGLTVVGYFVSPAGGEAWMVLANRALAVSAVWVVALIGVGRMKAESELRSSTDSLKEAQTIAQLGHWRLDLVTNELYWSDETYRIFGKEPQSFAASYEAFIEVIHPDDRERVDKAYADSLMTGEPYEITHRLLLKDSSIKYVNEKCQTEFDPDGKPLRSLGTVQDVTAIVEAEERVRTALAEKEVLLKEVHHRVKNNLQVISSILSLQGGYIENEEFKGVFSECQNRIRSMALIHERLYSSGDFVCINLAEYIKSLATALLRSYKSSPSRIELKLTVPDYKVDIDTSMQLGLIINELCSNALKHAFNGHAFTGGAPGELRVEFTPGTDGFCTLVVSDNGVGLPEGFDLMTGHSMGLQLISSMVTQMGGTIEVEGEGGARFTLRFPCSAEGDSEVVI